MALSRVDDNDTTGRLRVDRREDVDITPYCPQRPYISLTLPGKVKDVQSITFTIESHDQGYCSNKADGSWTWFAAYISRPLARNIIAPKEIFANKMADWAFKETTRTWTATNADLDIRGIVTTLGANDTIHVVPKAMFKGWRNYVRSASISVLYVKKAEPVQTNSKTQLYSPKALYYDHLDIDSKEIRLIYLHPGKHNDPLSCHLQTVALGNPGLPDFEALSYCWGSIENPGSLSLRTGPNDSTDAHTKSITNSLDEALRRLRWTDACRPLWVDAVCIDQGDIDERSSQVQFMGEIYSAAASVVVWLGASDALALQAVEVLHSEFTEYQTWRLNKRGRIPLTYSDQRPLDEWHSRFIEIMKSLSRLFSYPWFRRVWVVQELWLASKATVYCGDETVSWDSIMLASYWMRGGEAPGVSWVTLPSLWTTIQEVRDATAAAADRRIKMLTLVLNSLELRATNPRDKIFALLGLGKETHSRDIIPRPLLPDYNKPVSWVFADFTRWWIQTYKKLTVLSAIHGIRGRTWQNMEAPGQETKGSDRGPDSIELHSPTWALCDDGNALWAVQALGLQAYTFRATGDSVAITKVCTEYQQHTHLLILEGELLGEITDIGPYEAPSDGAPGADPDSLDMQAAFEWIFDPAGTSRTWNSGATIQANAVQPEQVREDLQVHLDAHKSRVRDKDADGSTKSYRRFPCISNCLFKLHEATPAVASTLDDDSESMRVAEGSAQEEVGPGGSLIPKMGSRPRILDSSDELSFGRPVGAPLEGLCPAGARPGDVVALLYGGDVLFILRELEQKRVAAESSAGSETWKKNPCGCQHAGQRYYALVGECYLKGYMDGTAFEARQRRGLQAKQWFALI